MRPNHYITAVLILFAMQQGIAQNFYIDKWREVEQFELQDRIEDATQVVDEIYKYARRKKDRDQYIKVFLFKSKYQLINEEEAQYKIIAELDKMIVKAQFPNKNIYNGIRAKLLDDYARANQWKIRQRTAVEDDDVDFKTWDATRFYSEIHNSYQASLDQPEKLVKIPLSDYSAIIGPMAPARFLRPSLLDILSHQALNFYKSGYFNLTKPKEEFIITKENAFLNTAHLLKLKRPAGDTVFSKYDVMQQYAHLEAMHLTSNNDAAFIHVITDRLWYAQNQLGNYQVYEDYEKQLQSIITSYDANPAVTEAYYYLALYHQNLSNQVGEEQQYSHRQKAIQLVNKAIDLYPKSYGAALCEQLKNQMYQSSINVQVEDLIIPNRPHRGVVSYSNVEQIDLYYIKVSVDEDLKDLRFADSLYQQFIDKAIDSQNLAHKESIQLPKGDDTFNHTYEYVAPAIEKGRYVVMAKTDKADEVKYAHTFITVTNLTLFKKDSELGTALLIKDRTTGKPIEGAVIQVTYNKKSRNFKSDRDGIAMYNIKSIRGRQEVLISNNGDSLSTNYYGYYRDKNDVAVDQEIFDVKTFTYLDRAIYRPGQTVYFKAILLKKKESDKQSSVVSNELLEIYAEDVNGTEIYRTKLKTNEFGSIHGSFEIPKDVLTGEFTLYIDEPDEETAFYNTVNDWEDGEINFKVEEYKRPTFEVDFNEITETYKLGDSVTVSGFGKAFLGSNVTNATVTYKVIRSYNYARWRSGYYGNSEKVILQGETTTDADGVFKIKFLAENDKDADSEYQPLYTYKIEADLTDLNGETRSASTTMRVGTNAIQIASQLPYQFTTEKNTLKVGVKNLNGQFVNGKLIVELRKQPQASHVIIASGLPQVEFQELDDKTYRNTFPYAELRKDELETDWKKAPIVFKKELTTDSLTTVELPITENWDNGAYYVYIKAVESDQSFDNEDDVIDSRTEKTIWANLELPLKPEIISVYSDYTEEAAIFNAFTSMNGVYATLTLWTDKELIEEKLIFLKKGKTELKYPWSQINGKQISIQLQVQKENGFEQTNMATVEKPVDPVAQYQIKTQSFRNKLQPGGEETWSFTIKDDNQIPMQAEVLASMYDKSLDEFATANWSAPFIRNNQYSFSPSLYQNTSYNRSQSLYVQFPRNNNYNSSLCYDSFNFFGLSFNNFYGNYNYYKEITRRKFKKLEAKKGFITGQVMDTTGEPVLGATILIKGSERAVTTDFDGVFSIQAIPEDVLAFSFAGYTPQEITVGSQEVVNVVMKESLNAVIVTAYGTAMMSSEMIQNEPVGDFEMIIDGKAPGLLVNAGSGQPVVAAKVRIRGTVSIDGANDPLYIVDGEVVTGGEFAKMNANSFNSVSVLKDAQATALYGSRAAAGVIVISTKDGVTSNDLILREMNLNNVQARKNLQETAFFFPELRTDKKGYLKFSFTSPETLTQWKLRLLAHDKKGKTAQLEQLVVTQKELNVIPNAPRFLRETDTIRFSAKIANLSDAAMDGTARLQLFDAMTMKAIDVELGNVNNNRDFTIEKDGNTSVNWTFRIPLGTQAVTYRVVAAAGNFSDGEENTLPVLSNRMLVSESRALWVRAGETKTAVMDNLSASDSGTMAHHQMVFEYTSNPSWYAIKSLPYLMEYEHECAEQTFSRYYANAMAHHILTSNPKVKMVFDSWAQNGTNVSALEKNEELKTVMLSHTPWLRDAQSEAQKQQRIATLFDLAETAKQKKKTLAKLEKLQGDSGGFPWFNGGYTNEYITRHIAAGLGHMKKLGIKNDDTPQTDRMYKNAIDALDTEWKKRFNRYLENHQTLKDYSYGNAFWHYQYARSFDVSITENSDEVLEKAMEYAFAKAEKSYSSQPLYTKLLMAITLHRNGKTKLASSIMEGLKQTAVKSDENGMYWKENKNSWYWYSSDIQTQALAIEAFQEVTADLNSIEELKIWLLKNKRTNQWKSTKATADATYALLLQGGKWLDVEENNKITWGNKPLPVDKMKAVEKEAGTGYFKITMNAPEVYKEFGTVTVKNKSDVTGYGALYWQYFEDLDKIKVDDDLPLSVKKKLFKKVMTDSGEKLEEITSEDPLKIGDLITVRLIIKTNADMDFVHLKDMRASGFEPVDVISKYKWQDGLGYYQSTKDVATHFFFDQMNKGTYVFEYDVRASNAGQFSNGITQLECMYAPEFSSHSEGMRVKIEE
ncbi:alpha-2-macroglobulin family protein [Nonlabens ulvanivorans]|uniref:alpha-2-macroglobulin family protein n=1 Tax=Nonlabens ulvanivorans TaxID=906888 RepID=UPI002943906B|nr:MG2 domain-containing protein [Nonlabens ulvanivorans]WOI22747.1 MG2 domain-containing protein [Nonlabens ulvanivorans]